MMRKRSHPRREELLRWIDRELDFEDCSAIDTHVQNCPPCRRELDRLRHVEEALLQLPAPALDSTDRERLKSAIAERIDRSVQAPDGRVRNSAPARRRTAVRWAVLSLCSAATLLIGVLLGRLTNTGDESTTSLEGPSLLSMHAPSETGAEAERNPAATITETTAQGQRPENAEQPDEGAASTQHATSSRTPDALIVESHLSVDSDALFDRERAALRDAEQSARVRSTLSASTHAARSLAELKDLSRVRLASLLTNIADQSDEVAIAQSALHHLAAFDPPLAESEFPLAFSRSLERWLTEDATEQAAFAVLQSLQRSTSGQMRILSRAWSTAMREPRLREQAVLDRVSALCSAAEWREIERLLTELVRSSEDGDQHLAELCLAILPKDDAAIVGVLDVLYAEGVDRALLRRALAELRAAGLEALLKRIDGEPNDRADRALRLVALGKVDSAVTLIGDLVRRGKSIAPALDALQVLGSVSAANELFLLSTNGSLANRRRSLARDALCALLAECAEPPELVAALLAKNPPELQLEFLALLLHLPAATSGEVWLSVARNDSLDPATRSAAAFRLAERANPELREPLLAALERERSALLLTSGELPPLLAPLLVAVHRADPQTGIDQALERLGLELEARQRTTLGHWTALAASERSLSRVTEQVVLIERLLRSGP